MGVLFKNSKWLCPDLDNVTQGQTNCTILYHPWSHKTFVWNIFS